MCQYLNFVCKELIKFKGSALFIYFGPDTEHLLNRELCRTGSSQFLNNAELVEQISHINPPRANEYKELYLRKQNGDSKATNRMIEMYLRTALRFSLDAAEKTSLPLDEIFSEAVIGLAEYVQRYDLQKNRLFSSYIISGIHQGINAYIRQNRDRR